jgi:hypothetical protein
VPIAGSGFEWDAVPDRSRNGAGGDVAAIIADAEEE